MFVKISWGPGKLVLFALAVIALLGSSIVPVVPVRATPGSGVTAALIVSATFLEAIPAQFKTETGSVQADIAKTMLIKYTLAPGGVLGWHEHGGPLWTMVDSGSLTFYRGDDPSCSGEVYPAGTTFIDPGNQTHNARNEGTKNAVVYMLYMLPKGGAARHDVPDPGNCPFEGD